MALLLILLAVLGFALASFGSSGGSSSSGTVTLAPTKCVQRAGTETTPPHCPPPANP